MTTSTHKPRANKFLLAVFFLLTFYLVYWYGHPQLIMQKWQDLTFEVRDIVEGTDEDEIQALVDELNKTGVQPNEPSNHHSSPSN